MTRKQFKITVLTDDGEYDIEVSIRVDDSEDEIDEMTKITTAATRWCSDNGHAYETWEYIN